MEEKRCTGPCGQVKPLDEFVRDRSKRDGHKSRCRACWPSGRHRTRDPAKERERVRRWAQANPEKVRECQAATKDRLRAAVFGHYGTVCACCGATEKLSIDHVDGDGGEHREELSGGAEAGGHHFYRWLVKNGFPPGYQTLCLPCNQSKGQGERCRIDH
jgi:hypothetical protein